MSDEKNLFAHSLENSDPGGKTKSVEMTEEGFLKAKELCERHFRKEQNRTRNVEIRQGG